VIDDIQRYSEPVREIWAEFVSVFRFPAPCNAYYTPAGQMTFPTHWDTDDVFILQLEGRKSWTIFEPTIQDPLEYHKWDKYSYQLGEPVLDVVLEPGDVLYVPRGFSHTVVSHAAYASFHLTYGVSIPTWHMSLKLLLRRLLLECGQLAVFRQPCPALFEGRHPKAESQAYWELLQKELQERLTIGAMRESVEDFMTRYVLFGFADGDLGTNRDASSEGSPPPGQRLYRRPEIAFLDRNDRGAVLKFCGKAVVFPRVTYSVLRHIAELDSFLPQDLPGDLTWEERAVVLDRLQREGFLTNDENESKARPLRTGSR
jgi:hypothetical protein